VGLALAALGVVGYAVQLWAGLLTAPWYLPCLATLGAGFIVASLWQARTAWRIVVLLLLVLFAGAAWNFLLAPMELGGTRLAAYAGPLALGQPFPVFATTRADATPFTQRDLEGDRNHVFVFFRGRW
jgi:hypothetical protein